MIKYRFNPLGLENSTDDSTPPVEIPNNLLCLFHFNGLSDPDYINGCVFTPNRTMLNANTYTNNGRFGKAIETTSISPDRGVDFKLSLNKTYKKITVDFWAYKINEETYKFKITYGQISKDKSCTFLIECTYSEESSSPITKLSINNSYPITFTSFGMIGSTWTHFLITYDLESAIVTLFINGLKQWQDTMANDLEYIDEINFNNFNFITEGYTDELRIVGDITNTSNFLPPTKEYLYGYKPIDFSKPVQIKLTHRVYGIDESLGTEERWYCSGYCEGETEHTFIDGNNIFNFPTVNYKAQFSIPGDSLYEYQEGTDNNSTISYTFNYNQSTNTLTYVSSGGDVNTSVTNLTNHGTTWHCRLYDNNGGINGAWEEFNMKSNPIILKYYQDNKTNSDSYFDIPTQEITIEIYQPN